MTITKLKKLQLKQQAHKLKPIVIIGANGLTNEVHIEIDRGLNDHELMKIRVNANDRDERRAMTSAICEHHQAELITTIGHIIVIYRQRKE